MSTRKIWVNFKARSSIREEEVIKVPVLRRIFGRSFYDNFVRIVSYANKVIMKNTGKKASKIGTLIISSSLRESMLWHAPTVSYNIEFHNKLFHARSLANPFDLDLS